jgi:hypothetical protein
MPAQMNEQRIDVEPNNKLSELDKAHINLFYPFDNSATYQWTIATVLQVVGFDEETKKCIQGIYDSRAKDPNYWMRMRRAFRAWCAWCRAGRNDPPSHSSESSTRREKRRSLTR